MNKEAFIGLVAVIAAMIVYIVTGSATSAIQGFFGAGLIALVAAFVFRAITGKG